MSKEVKDEDSVCSIYDYSNIEHNKAEGICNKMMELVNSNQYGDIKFSYSYNGKKKMVRIILTGTIMKIHTFMNEFIASS